jgi:RNA polymerase-binding protein DksA
VAAEFTKLNKPSLRRIRERLLQTQADLLRGASDVAQVVDQKGDYGDIAEARQRSDLAACITDEEWRKVRDIDAALRAISTGQYGLCADCGGQIAASRLAALPWAQLCIECKESAESEAA